ncbi:MAG: hypothetical protein COB02_13830 [Candidatus Cloacimonadota bacterium]|nr:MAG: hypothetical protein COB02_13830 [Candidatus Cloacimonadota bacterium]
MTKKDKLYKKLQASTINASEIRTLLGHFGWTKNRTKGSHEQWTDGSKVITLATHNNELKTYIIKQIKKALK